MQSHTTQRQWETDGAQARRAHQRTPGKVCSAQCAATGVQRAGNSAATIPVIQVTPGKIANGKVAVKLNPEP
jgi:hypothetical protein